MDLINDHTRHCIVTRHELTSLIWHLTMRISPLLSSPRRRGLDNFGWWSIWFSLWWRLWLRPRPDACPRWFCRYFLRLGCKIGFISLANFRTISNIIVHVPRDVSRYTIHTEDIMVYVGFSDSNSIIFQVSPTMTIQWQCKSTWYISLQNV